MRYSLCGVLQTAIVGLLKVPLLHRGHGRNAGKVKVIPVDEAENEIKGQGTKKGEVIEAL